MANETETFPIPPAVLVESANVAVSDTHALITFFGVAIRAPDAKAEPIPLFTAAIPRAFAPLLVASITNALAAHDTLSSVDVTKPQ